MKVERDVAITTHTTLNSTNYDVPNVSSLAAFTTRDLRCLSAKHGETNWGEN